MSVGRLSLGAKKRPRPRVLTEVEETKEDRRIKAGTQGRTCTGTTGTDSASQQPDAINFAWIPPDAQRFLNGSK